MLYNIILTQYAQRFGFFGFVHAVLGFAPHQRIVQPPGNVYQPQLGRHFARRELIVDEPPVSHFRRIGFGQAQELHVRPFDQFPRGTGDGQGYLKPRRHSIILW